jgi:hypothetical protein
VGLCGARRGPKRSINHSLVHQFIKIVFGNRFISLASYLKSTMFVCLFVTMRPAGTRCICELYWHNITSFNHNSFHTIHAPVRFEPASTRDPTATHHLSLPGLRYKTLLTTCQTSSPVDGFAIFVK